MGNPPKTTIAVILPVCNKVIPHCKQPEGLSCAIN